MIFVGAVPSGIKPFGCITAMVAIIGLWLVIAPSAGAVARTTSSRPHHSRRKRQRLTATQDKAAA